MRSVLSGGIWSKPAADQTSVEGSKNDSQNAAYILRNPWMSRVAKSRTGPQITQITQDKINELPVSPSLFKVMFL